MKLGTRAHLRLISLQLCTSLCLLRVTDELDNNMTAVKANTGKANEQLKKADRSHRRQGKMLLCIAIIILCVCGVILAILFGTNVLG